MHFCGQAETTKTKFFSLLVELLCSPLIMKSRSTNIVTNTTGSVQKTHTPHWYRNCHNTLYVYMYRRVRIDMSTWDGLYNPVHPRIREAESKHTHTEIAGNAMNGNILTSIRRPSMTVFTFATECLTEWLTYGTECLTLLAPTQCRVKMEHNHEYFVP